MMVAATYVAPSRIEGIGIFAAEPIAAGTEIWRNEPWFDRTFRRDEIERMAPVQRAYVERYGYTHVADPGLVVIEGDNGRFMNHSDTPNTDFTRPDRGYAIRDIAAGEEITCDYGEFEPGFAILPGRNFVLNGAGEQHAAI